MVLSSFSQHEDLDIIAFIFSAPHLINYQALLYILIDVFLHLYTSIPSLAFML